MHPFLNRHTKIEPVGNITFQIVDIYAKDEVTSTEYSDDGDEIEIREYIIHLFGITKDSESVHLRISGFCPYFFVKVPDDYSTYQVNKLKNHITGSLSKYNKGSFKGIKLEKRMDYYGFNNFKKEKYVCIYLKNRKCLYETRQILSSRSKHMGLFTDDRGVPKFYESKLEPFLRFLHIQEIQPAGWVTVSEYSNCFTSNSQIDIQTTWTKVSPFECATIAPYLQASFDIECVPGDGIRFPEYDQPDDSVIQIGTTVHKLGDSNDKPLKHIVTLKSCDPIPGVIVESYDTEAEMLIGWVNFIVKLDPDIITGYNIYGFDFKYIYERAKLLGILHKFKNISRFRNFDAKLIEKKLSSSALGTNVMYYMDSPGRLIIDLYKVCQRDYKFDSYKLDDVAGEFIRGNIEKFKIGKKYTYLTVNSTIDLEVGNFIGITINKLTKYEKNDTLKFIVKKLEKNKIVIEGVHNLPTDKTLQWKLMKDDVKYTDLFKYQKKDAKHRAIIAKYCFVAGTKVSLPGCSVDIETLKDIDTDVVSWVENKGFSTSNKKHFFDNGVGDCVKVTMSDGTNLKCTKDHRILTKDGWIEAQYLNTNHRVICNPEPAYIDYKSEHLEVFKFSDKIGELNYEKSCIFSRIIGYVLTDGCIYSSSCYKNYSNGWVQYKYDNAKIYLGTKIDAKNLQMDINKLTGKMPTFRKSKYTYDITLPTELTSWILSLDGISVGKRLSSANDLPNIFNMDDCPKWIIREFLKGLMGGDGGCPSLSNDKFSCVAFYQSKTYENKDSLLNMMEKLQKLFNKFDIDTIISNESKNAVGEGYSRSLKIKQHHMIKYYEKIGYAYCTGKTYSLAIACSYYKSKNETKRQSNWVCDRTEILRQTMTPRNALLSAHSELKRNEPIFNEYYSLPTLKSTKLISKKQSPGNLKYRKKYFPSPIEYAKLTESYEYFPSIGNKKSHAVNRDDEYSPCYVLSVLRVDDIGKHHVYDIEVENTHNFVANGVVVHNCIQDNILCSKLLDKLKILVNNIGMANVCYVPMSYLFLRGQGIKAYSLVAKKCRMEGYLIPDREPEQIGDKYQGATVLNATAGGYFHPISCNDFASLYPSSIISHNLSPDTLILDTKYKRGVHINNIDCGNDIKYEFVKPEDGDVPDEANRKGRGIIPKVLIELLASRKRVKGLMKTEKNPFQKSILDGLQLSYKLTCNSIYGQMGSTYSQIACKPVAEACTATGRMLLEFAAKETKVLYPMAEIIYGDSVTGDTPLLLKYPNGQITLKTIETLSSEWKSYEELKPFDTIESNRREKQQSITDMEVWSDNGWNPIKRVIRHKCNKKIFRVNTHCGVVDVTEDHSLLDENSQKLKAEDCIVNNTKLLQSFPEFEGNISGDDHLNDIMNSLNNLEATITEKRAFLYGFFYGDGSCGYYQCNSGDKYSWAFNNADKKVLEIMKKWLTDIFSIDFKILETMESSGVYKLVPVGKIKMMVSLFRDLFYDKDKYKIVPDCILNGTLQERKDFFKGYYLADGAKCNGTNLKNIRMCNKGKIGASQLYYLMKSLGYKTSLQIRSDKQDIYRLTSTIGKQRKAVNVIKKIIDMGHTNDYVYDLETIKGKFQAGVGEIIVKNTDSIMTKYVHVKDNPTPEEKKEALQKSIECAMQVEKVVSGKLPWPHNLEYEKTYYPYILYSKKRYSGVMYEHDVNNYKEVDNKGIVLKRRDNAKIVKFIFGGALNIILFEQNIEKAYAFIRKCLDDLCDGKFTMDFLVISKTLKVTKTDPAHKILAQRMAERDPGNAPNLNDRIPYIFVELRKKEQSRIMAEQGRKKLLQGDKIEHPEYVKENNMKPDYIHYITNQVMNPILQLLAIFEEDNDQVTRLQSTKTDNMTEDDIDKIDKQISKIKESLVERKLFHSIIRRQQARQNGMKPLDMFFKKKV